MLQTKKSVDEHVLKLFYSLKNENEKTMQCREIAQLYYKIGEYECALRYAYRFLEVKPDSTIHRLLAQVLTALGHKELAVLQYDMAVIHGDLPEDDLVRACELVLEKSTSFNIKTLEIWYDIIDKRIPEHEILPRMKNKIDERFKRYRENPITVYEGELNPLNPYLMESLRNHSEINHAEIDNTYEYMVKMEFTQAYRNCIQWYGALCQFLCYYKKNKQVDWSFWVLFVSSLERYAALSLKEHGNPVIKILDDATETLVKFDQGLTEAKHSNDINNFQFMKKMFTHMRGQLQYHLACLLLKKALRNQENWSEIKLMCGALLLGAAHTQPIDTTEPWMMSLKEDCRAQLVIWFEEGSYRCSQAGHILQDYVNENPRKIMNKIDEFYNDQWRDKVYRKIFNSNFQEQWIDSSYFVNDSVPYPPLCLLPIEKLNIYDRTVKEVYPESLHHHIWLAIANKPRQKRSAAKVEPYPNATAHIFPDLQFSAYNLSQCTPQSIGQLDVDAFLNAAVLCSSNANLEQLNSGFSASHQMSILPANIISPLCTSAQQKWWSLIYNVYQGRKNENQDLTKVRQDVECGLKIIRCIGKERLHPKILSHLARIFQHRAEKMKIQNKSHRDLRYLEARYELYWSSAVSLLNNLNNEETNENINNEQFYLQSKQMSNIERKKILKEGRLAVSQKLMSLKRAEPQVHLQGDIYEQMANDLLEEAWTNRVNPNVPKYISILKSAITSYYLAMDRLRSSGTNKKTLLQTDLGLRIARLNEELKFLEDPTSKLGSHLRDFPIPYFLHPSRIFHQINNEYDSLSDTTESTTQPLRRSLRIRARTFRHDEINLTPRKTSLDKLTEMTDEWEKELIQSFTELNDDVVTLIDETLESIPTGDQRRRSYGEMMELRKTGLARIDELINEVTRHWKKVMQSTKKFHRNLNILVLNTPIEMADYQLLKVVLPLVHLKIGRFNGYFISRWNQSLLGFTTTKRQLERYR